MSLDFGTSQEKPGRGYCIVKNNSAEEIPGRSFVQVVGTEVANDGGTIYLVEKLSSASGDLLVTNHGKLGTTGTTVYGLAFHLFDPVWVNYDSGNAPTAQAEAGPVASSYELSSAGSGYQVRRVDATNTRALIVPLNIGSATGEDPYDVTDGSNGNCGCNFIASGSVDIDGVGTGFASQYVVIGGFGAEFGTDDVAMNHDSGEWVSDDIEFDCGS